MCSQNVIGIAAGMFQAARAAVPSSPEMMLLQVFQMAKDSSNERKTGKMLVL